MIRLLPISALRTANVRVVRSRSFTTGVLPPRCAVWMRWTFWPRFDPLILLRPSNSWRALLATTSVAMSALQGVTRGTEGNGLPSPNPKLTAVQPVVAPDVRQPASPFVDSG